jgi:hypothetical protein
MKYSQLTKEQFEALHKEFATFLASQQIDANEWKKIKEEKPKIATEELAIFSDLVWDDVLNKTRFVDHVSEKHINLFQCTSKEMIRIYVKAERENFNFLNDKDFNYFRQNPLSDEFNYFKASKKYEKERNLEIFNLIEMGAQITQGELFKKLLLLIR